MLKSNLCEYRNAYTAGATDVYKHAEKRGKGVVFENCALFTYCISKINIQIDNAKYLNVGLLMYNLTESIYKTGSFDSIADMILVRQIMLL